MIKLRNILTCIVAFFAVVLVDYATGYEVSSFPLYLLPIVLSVFYFGPKIAFVVVIISVTAWTANDILTGHTYAYEAIRYWNAFARLLVYSLAVYGLAVYLTALNTHRKRIEDLRKLLPICTTCGKIMWKDGTWKTPQEILESVESVQHTVDCPTCEKHLEA